MTEETKIAHLRAEYRYSVEYGHNERARALALLIESLENWHTPYSVE